MTRLLPKHPPGRDDFFSITRKMGEWVEHVLAPGYNKYLRNKTWSPAINLYEDRNSYYVVVDLAGVRASDIDLRVEKGVMIISGHRPTPVVPQAKDGGGQVCLHMMEIDYGHFARQVQMPRDADLDSIDANYCHGYLWVRIARNR